MSCTDCGGSPINNPCPFYPNASCVIYDGDNLSCIGAITNDRLDTILQKINDKLCTTPSLYTFTNAIHQETGQIVKWGGQLVEDTTIESNGYNVTFSTTLGDTLRVADSGDVILIQLPNSDAQTVLTTDSSGVIQLISLTDIPPLYTFTNGLSEAGFVVKLGGPLIQDTNIDFSSFNLSLSDVPSGTITNSLGLDVSGNIVTGTTGVSLTATQMAFGDGSNLMTSSANLTYSSSAVTILNTAITTGLTAGLILNNTTAATSGNQKYSPSLRLKGQGFKTNDSTSHTIIADIRLRPIQGAANAGWALDFLGDQDTGSGSTTGMTLQNTAGISNSYTLSVFNNVTASNGTVTGVYGSFTNLIGTLDFNQTGVPSQYSGRLNGGTQNLILQSTNTGSFTASPSNGGLLLYCGRQNKLFNNQAIDTTSGNPTITITGNDMDCDKIFRVGESITVNGETKVISSITGVHTMDMTTNWSNNNTNYTTLSGITFPTADPPLVVLSNGQVATGTSAPHASARFQVDSTDQGQLPPRMTGVQAEAIASPEQGLFMFITNGNGVSITSIGWWGWDGSAWAKFN